MDYLAHKRFSAKRRTHRVRTNIHGTPERPRLSVYISNYHVSAQIIDDTTGKTLAYATTVGQKIEGNMSAKASWVGKEIASRGKKAKLSKVVFDKGKYKYHGRVKSLAEAARNNGLEF
jgi:large subunit ribosomal protein L18